MKYGSQFEIRNRPHKRAAVPPAQKFCIEKILPYN